MYGSILFNCWGALVGFSIYFMLSLQNLPASPLIILTGSFVTAIVVFVVIFLVRILLHFIFFTPEQDFVKMEVMDDTNEPSTDFDDLPSFEQAIPNELQDENAEEIAKAVRTMMHSEQTAL